MRMRILPFCMALIMALTMTSTVAFAGTDDVINGTKVDVAAPAAEEIGAADQALAPDFDKTQPEALFESSLSEDMQACTEKSQDGLLKVYKPAPGKVFYVGEKIKTKNSVYDSFTDYYTRSDFYTFDANGNLIDGVIGDVAKRNTWTTYKGQLPLDPAKYTTGGYTMMFVNVPCYSDGTAVDGWGSMDVPKVLIKIKVKILKPPTKLKLRSWPGGKIVLTFPKCKGAGKYKIYRTTDPYNGTFKCVKTTGKRKYVDRKVKKGKNYYYYVRSMRSKSGKILSDPSSIWYVPAI